MGNRHTAQKPTLTPTSTTTAPDLVPNQNHNTSTEAAAHEAEVRCRLGQGMGEEWQEGNSPCTTVR